MQCHFWEVAFVDGIFRIRVFVDGISWIFSKSKDANTIKAFRPICLLNVSFKILTKSLAKRLTQVANKIIGEN